MGRGDPGRQLADLGEVGPGNEPERLLERLQPPARCGYLAVPSRISTFMRRLLITCFALAPLLVGCASLRARMIAQQGVDLYHKQAYAAAAAKFAEAETYYP